MQVSISVLHTSGINSRRLHPCMCVQCDSAIRCQNNRAFMMTLPTLVFFNKCHEASWGCKHRPQMGRNAHEWPDGGQFPPCTVEQIAGLLLSRPVHPRAPFLGILTSLLCCAGKHREPFRLPPGPIMEQLLYLNNLFWPAGTTIDEGSGKMENETGIGQIGFFFSSWTACIYSSPRKTKKKRKMWL